MHRYFQRWTRAGVFKKLWKSGLEEYAEVQGIDWKWQAVDGAITKSPLGGQATGANPTDRGKCGTKRSMLVEAQGVPIGLEVGPAQRPDVKLLAATLEAVEVEPPDPTEPQQHLSLGSKQK